MFVVYLEDNDFGQQNCLFSSKDKAREWMGQVIATHPEYFTFQDESTDTVESLEKDGYFEIVEMEIDPNYTDEEG